MDHVQEKVYVKLCDFLRLILYTNTIETIIGLLKCELLFFRDTGFQINVLFFNLKTNQYPLIEKF